MSHKRSMVGRHRPSNEKLFLQLDDPETFEQAFCMIISRNSDGRMGDREETINLLGDALERAFVFATPRMFRIYVAHVGYSKVHPYILELMKQQDSARPTDEEVLAVDRPQPAPPKRHLSRKKLRKLEAAKKAAADLPDFVTRPAAVG